MEAMQYFLPAIAAAFGSVVATKVSVARLESDVKTLFGKVDALTEGLHKATLEQKEEHGVVKSDLATLNTRIDALQSPWKRQTN